jgi:hypothetical protein
LCSSSWLVGFGALALVLVLLLATPHLAVLGLQWRGSRDDQPVRGVSPNNSAMRPFAA